MKDALNTVDKWSQYLAAKALLWNGYPHGIKENFTDKLSDADPQYKIAIWDILAKTSDNDTMLRNKYVENIYNAALNSSGKQRHYALEILAELEFSQHLDELRNIAETAEPQSQVYARWILAAAS